MKEYGQAGQVNPHMTLQPPLQWLFDYEYPQL